MTANAMTGGRQECLDAGMDDFVSKPIRQSELRRVLDAIAPVEVEEPSQTKPVQHDLSPNRDGVTKSGSEYDWDTVLNAMGGNRDLLQQVALAMKSECPSCMDQIDQAMEQSDSSLLRRAAHTLKGSLRLFGSTTAG